MKQLIFALVSSCLIFSACSKGSSGSGGGGTSDATDHNSLKAQIIPIKHDPSACNDAAVGRYYPDLESLNFTESVAIDRGAGSVFGVSMHDQVWITGYTDGEVRCSLYNEEKDLVCAVAGCEGTAMVLSYSGHVNGQSIRKKFYVNPSNESSVYVVDVTVTNDQKMKLYHKQ